MERGTEETGRQEDWAGTPITSGIIRLLGLKGTKASDARDTLIAESLRDSLRYAAVMVYMDLKAPQPPLQEDRYGVIKPPSKPQRGKESWVPRGIITLVC